MPDSPARSLVTRQYATLHQAPLRHAEEIGAVWMVRDPGTAPGDPIRIHLDQSLYPRLGWRPGEQITPVPIDLDRATGEGKLILRRANPGEPSLTLQDPGPLQSRDDHWRQVVPPEVHGTDFSWSFPTHWVETFFPGFLSGPPYEVNSQTDYSWSLYDLLDQREQLELSLGVGDLFFYLQRTSHLPTRLDVHLIPGVLHRMGWSPSTPLVIDSESGFNPFASEDALTIRVGSTGGSPDLVWGGAHFEADVSPIWLNRFFPDIHDPDGPSSAEEWDHEIDRDDDPGDDRDIFHVPPGGIEFGPDAVSFVIDQPRRL